MVFKKYNSRFWILLILLQSSMIALAWFIIVQKWYITSAITGVLIIILAFGLLSFVRTTNRKLAQFLNMTTANDHNMVFGQKKIGSGFDELHIALNAINEKLKSSRIDQESQFLLFKGMINNLDTGILVLSDTNDVLLTNPSFYRLLDLPEDNNWQRLQKRIPVTLKQINAIKDQQREIINLNDQNNREKQLLVSKRQFIINSENYTFFSFRNIRKELEKKEVESWHRLIKVLTHEIMNSVSPIVSLSSTLQLLLSNQIQEGGQHIMDSKNFEDLELSAKTIQNRGKGLMDFIDEYSKLTKVPQPKIETFNIEDSLKEMKLLLADKIEKLNIDFKLEFSKPNLNIKADRTGVIKPNTQCL
jgi:nitrogen fixation/metabolism regulation signal transduction histidine kinase